MLSNLKTGTKVFVALLFATAVLLGVGAFSWLGANSIAERLDETANQKIPSIVAQASIGEGQTALEADLWILESPRSSTESRRVAFESIKSKLAEIDEAIRTYQGMPHQAETWSLWKTWKEAFAAWRPTVDRVASLIAERDRVTAGGKAGNDPAVAALDAEAWDALQQGLAAHERASSAIEAVLAKTRADARQAGQAGGEAAHRMVTSIVVLVLAAAIVLVLLAVFLTRRMGGTVRALVDEAAKLRDAVAAGHLDVRGADRHLDAEFRPIVAGMNRTMEAFEKPIRMTAEYLSSIGQGKIPPRITAAYQGDFNLIKSSLNDCIDAVNLLVADSASLAKAGVEGQLSFRADASKHQGEFRKVMQGVNDTLDAVGGPLQVAARFLDEISRGAIPGKITTEYQGDFDAIKQSINRCVDAVNALMSDANGLVEAAVAGKLTTRADLTRHQGDFRKVVEGVNRTLDAVIGPLTATAKCVDEISRGAVPKKITDSYPGDFNAIKNSLNTCIEAVNRLVTDADGLAQAAVAGQLSIRADASKHQGDFKKVVEGFNRTLDAVLAPVQEAAATLDKLANRDLRARVSGHFQGDHARIKESVNATAQALHDALAQVAEAVEQVSSASQQIASSSHAVASGASEQASSLEETSSSIDAVSSITKQAADNAVQANSLAKIARTAATDGAAAVEQMQGAMVKIRASAEGTSQIIRDINDIAFQTNLLALNAAVEAARAGEAGRGFAVVAEEVRSLALRAKEAAMKTEELIRESVKQAGEGEQRSKQVAGKLGEIVAGIGKVADIVSEITAAAKEQSSGINQVNKAVGEMDRVTQQNAASAEESSSAASELNGQAEQLAAMVGAFQLDRVAARTALQRPDGAARAPGTDRALLAKTKQTRPAPRSNGKLAAVEERFPMDDETELRDF